MTQTKQKSVTVPKKNWEIKDRTYLLLNEESPLTYRLGSRHSTRYPLLWFDEEKGEQRELRYATNQNSPFVDEQKGESTMGHIVFEDGVLTVGKQQQNLQRLLSLYHPRIGATFKEFEPHVVAENEVEKIHAEIEALMFAKELDIDQAEAILRVEKGTSVSKMSSKEIKRDLLLMAKKNPIAFMAIANDENVGLRNTAIRASEDGIIKLSQDQRTFHWGSNNRKLLTIPFDENPYSAIASWFKTDEGVEVYKTIQKKLQ
tara:strand:+ start:230 stop:1006 length:777 start_codon:yes stop_codon:yes gene_type:complete